MTDASAKDARIAWTIGGSLMVASALFPLVTQGVAVPGLGLVSVALWAASLLVFAFGVRGHGSVVARRPLGVTALVIAAVIPIASTIFWVFVEITPEDSGWAAQVSQGVQVAILAALVTAAVQIARAGVVPPRLRWLPLIVLLVSAAMQAVMAAAFVNVTSPDAAWLPTLMAVAGLVSTAGPLVLGIAALVLAPRIGQADRVEPDPVQVYPPTP